MTVWTAPNIASLKGDNTFPLQKIFQSLTEEFGRSSTSLTALLALKADIVSPALTGVPAAPTAAPGTSTAQLATTAFVTTADNLKANIASPTFTGTVTTPALTVDGPSSPSFTVGDWGSSPQYAGLTGNTGYVLVGTHAADTKMYMRTSTAGTVNIGANNSNTLQVGQNTMLTDGHIKIPNTSAYHFGSANGSNFWQPMDAYNNMYFKVGTGNFYADSPSYNFRNLASVNMFYIGSGGVEVSGEVSLQPVSNKTRFSYNNNADSALPYGQGPQLEGQTGWSFYSHTTGTHRMGFRGNFANTQRYLWCADYVIFGSVPNDVLATHNLRVQGTSLVSGRFTCEGGYQGNVNYGSYGSISVYGINNSWYGIVFPDYATTWMSNSNGQLFGCYRNNTTWNFYVSNGTFTPSDERYKRDIQSLEYGMNLIREIVPITYDPLTEDPTDDPEQTVGRTHYGFTTQNILQALTNVGETRDVAIVDIGGPASELNESDRQYLNHTGLIAPMVKAIQELDQRIQQLETV